MISLSAIGTCRQHLHHTPSTPTEGAGRKGLQLSLHLCILSRKFSVPGRAPTAARPRGDYPTSRITRKLRFRIWHRRASRRIIADRLLGLGARRTCRRRTSISVSQTPLRFCLRTRIDLMKDTNVVSVNTSHDALFNHVTIEEKQADRHGRA